jgi:N-acyl-D-amino-acid deacylase
MVGELFSEEHLAEMVGHPLFSFGVDGYASAAGLSGHVPDSPLSYAGHIHYLAHHVRERGYLSLQQAVKKMTSMPATRFGLRRRGLLAKDYFADLVVFDPATVASDSSFTRPAVYPRGIELVVVNGTVVVDGKGETGALPGRILRP